MPDIVELPEQREEASSFPRRLCLVAEAYVDIDIPARGNDRGLDFARPVVLSVPEETHYCHASIKNVNMWFEENYLMEKPLARIGFGIQEGQPDDSGSNVTRTVPSNRAEFRFAVRAILRDQHATENWHAKLSVTVLCFG